MDYGSLTTDDLSQISNNDYVFKLPRPLTEVSSMRPQAAPSPCFPPLGTNSPVLL